MQKLLRIFLLNVFVLVQIFTIVFNCVGTSVYAAVPTPIELKLCDKTDRTVSFCWNFIDGITQYDIYINDSFAGTSEIINNVRVSRYTATDLNPATTYIFRVKAIIGTDESLMSAGLTITTFGTGEPVNEALGCFVSSSDKYNASFDAKNVVDGSVNDWIGIRPMWLSSISPSQHWVSVDLKSIKEVNQFVIVHAPASEFSGHADAYLKDYIIQGSNNNSTWIDLVSIVGNTSTTTTHTIEPTSYQYFRIYITKSGSTEGFSGICEFKILSTRKFVVNDINFTDANGNSILSIQQKDSISANSAIGNFGNTVSSNTLIIALYNDYGRLVNLNYVKKDIPINKYETLKTNINIPLNDGNRYYVKAFLWNNLHDINPVVSSRTINDVPTLNVSRDLINLKIAASNLTPNRTDIDARLLLNLAVDYAKNNEINMITAEPGNYYFLSLQNYDRHWEINGLNDATIDFNGANFYFKNSNTSAIVVKNCNQLNIRNFTIDYMNLPFTQVRVTAVNAITRAIEYENFPGWEDPSEFNDNRSPYGGDRIYMFVFRNGSRVKDVGRLVASTPTNGNLISVLDDGKKTTRAANLTLIMPGDYITYANRSGGYGMKVEDSNNARVENISIYAAGQFGLYMDTLANSIVDGVSIVPRPGTDRLISTNGDGIHLARARSNNIVRNSTVIGTCDDGIAVNETWLGIYDNKTIDRNVTIKRYQKGRFNNGQTIVFSDPITCNDVFSAVIVSQNPSLEQQLIQPNEQIILTLDTNVPTLPSNAGISSAVSIERGSGTQIINNRIEQVNLARGIYVAGLIDASISGNVISSTNMSGINVNEEIMPADWKFPSNHNVVIENNTINNAFMWGAPDGGFVNCGGALMVNAYNSVGNYATGTPFTNITVKNNKIINSARTAIHIDNVNGGDITNNIITNACHDPWPFWMGNLPTVEAEFRSPIVIRAVKNFLNSGNVVN